MKKEYKIIFAASGTAGHLFPAIELAKIVSQHSKVLFAAHGLKKNSFFNECFPFIEITSHRMSLKNPIKMIFCWKKGIKESFDLFQTFKPDLVIGFGSYHSFPLLAAATIKKVPFLLFSPDKTLGKVQKLFSFFSKGILSFFDTHPKSLKIDLSFLLKHQKTFPKRESRKKIGLQEDLFTILIFGGSQGSKFINENLPNILKKIKKPFQVIHITGKNFDPQKLRDFYAKENIFCQVKEFEEEMSLAYSSSDLVISRAGALTIAELIHFSIPSILIPYPHAYNHQSENAKFFTQTVLGGKMVEEKNFEEEKFLSILLEFFDPEYREKFIINLKEYKRKDKQTKNVLTIISEVIEKNI